MPDSFSRYAGDYPRQLVVSLSDETADRIEADAQSGSASKSSTIRYYVELGIKRHDALERAKRRERVPESLTGPTD